MPSYVLPRAGFQDYWAVYGCGFLQHMGDSDQGVPAAAAAFEENFRPLGVRVELRRWNEDWDDLAEWIFRRCSSPDAVRLLCVAYSWGVGFGFRGFARSCAKRGLKINAAVLSDGVAHLGGRECHRIGLSQVAAYLPPPSPCFKKIKRLKLWLPSNIERENTYWFVQENSWLRGHDIYWEDSGELAANKTVIKFRTHGYMDECPEFQDKAAEMGCKLFGTPPALAVA